MVRTGVVSGDRTNPGEGCPVTQGVPEAPKYWTTRVNEASMTVVQDGDAISPTSTRFLALRSRAPGALIHLRPGKVDPGRAAAGPYDPGQDPGGAA